MKIEFNIKDQAFPVTVDLMTKEEVEKFVSRVVKLAYNLALEEAAESCQKGMWNPSEIRSLKIV